MKNKGFEGVPLPCPVTYQATPEVNRTPYYLLRDGIGQASDHNKDISEGDISMLSEFKTCAERQYYSEYFQRLLKAIDSRDKMNQTVRSLRSENKQSFDHREAAIEAARKDLELVRLGMDAPQDSAAYKMAQALIEDAKQSS